MKKIALLHYTYPPQTGGVEHLLRQHAYVLANLGYEVTVLTGSGEEADSRIRLVVVPELLSIGTADPLLHERILQENFDDEFARRVIVIEEIFKKYLEEAEVVIVHNMLSLYWNIPFIKTFNSYVSSHPEKTYINWIHDFTFIGERRNELNNSSVVRDLLTTYNKRISYVTISHQMKQSLLEFIPIPEEKLLVVPNGISIQKYLSISPRIWEFAQKQRLLQRFPVLMSPVNITARKNIDYCIEVIKALKKEYPDVLYLVTGNTSEHKNTKEYFSMLKNLCEEYDIEDNVLFLQDEFSAPRTDEDIQDLYKLCDGVLFFTKGENFGLPVIEAGLSRVPLFVSDLPVFHEIGGNDLLVIDTKNTKPAAAAEMIKRDLLRNTMVALQRRVKTTYGLEEIFKTKVLSLFIK